MASKRKGNFKRGDRLTIFLGDELDDTFMNWINTQDKYGPAIIDIVRDKVSGKLVEAEKVELSLYRFILGLLTKGVLKGVSLESLMSEFNTIISPTSGLQDRRRVQTPPVVQEYEENRVSCDEETPTNTHVNMEKQGNSDKNLNHLSSPSDNKVSGSDNLKKTKIKNKSMTDDELKSLTENINSNRFVK